MEMQTFAEFKKEALKDKKIKAEYEKLGPEFELARMLIEKRLKMGMTQKQLAEKMGTTQSALSRFEMGGTNPSLGFLKKLAGALGTKLSVRLG